MKNHQLFTILAGLCIAPMLAYAQASLVKDIFPGGNSGPGELTNVNGTLFFSAGDGNGTHGRELWKSDGTKAGTVLVKDIQLGGIGSAPGELTNVNGTLFFSAGDGTHGRELWKSDGTKAGTALVKDIRLGGVSSTPVDLTNVNGTLFFVADDGTHGRELWKSDGTEAGTVLVKDINPGVGSGPFGLTNPTELTNVNGMLFFWTDGGSNEFQLWKSDGTEAGTVLVKHIPQLRIVFTHELTNVNGTLFFSATDATHGTELWKSDGTEAGTVVLDVAPGLASNSPSYLTNVNGTLFFVNWIATSGESLWKSDGTEAGTVLVKDINPGGFSEFFCCLTNVNGTLFLTAEDHTHGVELWKSDGTKAGTVLVKDINPGSNNSWPFSLINVNGSLFFSAWNAAHGQELWKSDGTETGTILIDINPGINSSSPSSLANIGSTLYLSANDGIHGHELWKYEVPMQKQAVQSFTLVNADTDTDILELTEGMQLEINTIPHAKLNIRANTDPPTVGSVFLQLSGTINSSRTENAAPYALFGDNKGDYNKHNLRLGDYTITATPYTKANKKGEEGTSLSLNFSLVANQVQNMRTAPEEDANSEDALGGERLLPFPQKHLVYPNPVAAHTLHLEYSAAQAGRGILRVIDMNGRVVIEQEISIVSGVNQIDIEAALLTRGQYVVSFEMGGTSVMQKVIKY